MPSSPAPDWQLLLGFPTGDFGGWSTLLDQAPALQGLPLAWIIPFLFAPLAILAALSLFLPGIRSASLAVLTVLLGAGTAIAATQAEPRDDRSGKRRHLARRRPEPLLARPRRRRHLRPARACAVSPSPLPSQRRYSSPLPSCLSPVRSRSA
ncbi:hypothetical protein KIV56_14350 [Cryobacterium breve]|uniref:Uncharacterized protein n=1 Tax=Cryobacterium breve TaxID=1259258 RepID=A0ABY7NAG7_9MICO|nr:hypothetical protein [Cryobacterium breve]WBM79502.1 hypothetical protein KIV56_14350 [Cryobacterium breve]